MVGTMPPDYELSDAEVLDRLVAAVKKTGHWTEEKYRQHDIMYWHGVVLSRLRNQAPPFGLGIKVRARINTQSFRIYGDANNFVRVNCGDVLNVITILFHPDMGWLFEAEQWAKYWLPFACADFEPVE